MTTANEQALVPNEQMLAELLALRAENAALRQAAASKLTIKISEKGAVCVYGLGRFPVTLYAGQWSKLLAISDNIKAFIRANGHKLAKKEDKSPEAVPSLEQWQAAQAEAGRAS